MKLEFEKELDKWYYVMPDYTGPKADLQMVCGADTFLELTSNGKDFKSFIIDFEDYDYELLFDREEASGAWYDLKSKDLNFEVWLCAVTLLVFKEFPKSIKLKNG